MRKNRESQKLIREFRSRCNHASIGRARGRIRRRRSPNSELSKTGGCVFWRRGGSQRGTRINLTHQAQNKIILTVAVVRLKRGSHWKLGTTTDNEIFWTEKFILGAAAPKPIFHKPPINVRFRTIADKRGFLARDGLSANDPKRTKAPPSVLQPAQVRTLIGRLISASRQAGDHT